MDDDNNFPGAHDPEHINVGDPYDVRRWCQRFVCTEAALRRCRGRGQQPDRRCCPGLVGRCGRRTAAGHGKGALDTGF